MIMKICIDPGHGGNDSGATSNGINEKDINLAISKKLAELLVGDYEISMTRDEDYNIPLMDRAIIANSFGSHIFVSIHNNASKNEGVQGTEVLHYPGSKDGIKLADYILTQMLKMFQRPSRGIKPRDDLSVLQQTEMPAVLIECGFITNSTERKLLQEDCCQLVIAISIKKGIDNYFKEGH